MLQNTPRLSFCAPQRILFVVTLLLVLPAAGLAQAVVLDGQQPAAQDPAPDPSSLSLEELLGIEVESVFGASKTLQKITEAPAAVTVVTADDITRFGWRTMADVMRNVRGFYATSDRNYGYLGARGFQPPGDYNARILVTIDGLRANDDIYDGALFDDNFQVDLDLVERVEVIRGPSSSLYGSNAFLAVINVVTKSPAPGSKSLVVTGGAGTLGSRDGRVRAARSFANGAALTIAGGIAESDGDAEFYTPEYDAPETNNGVAVGRDYMRRRNLFARVDHKGLVVMGLYNWWRHGNPNGAYGSIFNEPASNGEDHRMFSVAWTRDLAHQWTGVFRAGYDHYVYRGTYAYPDEAGSGVQSYHDTGVGQTWTGEAQFSRAFGRHAVTAGIEHRWNPQQDQFSYLGNSVEPYWRDTRTSQTTGLYVQEQWRLTPKVLINGGLRLDHYKAFKDPLKPRLAVIVQPTAATTIKAIYGSAFRAPSAYENFYELEGSVRARPDLRPEQVQTVEGVVEHYAGRRLRLSAGGFRVNVTDLIAMGVAPGEPTLAAYGNVAGSYATGVEAEAEARWPNGIHARLGYTFAKTRDHNSTEQLVNSPRHVTQGVLALPVGRGFFLAVDAQALSRRPTLAGASVAGYIRPGLSVSGPLGTHGRAVLRVDNASNTRYTDPVGEDFLQDTVQQYGRVARLQFSWAF